MQYTKQLGASFSWILFNTHYLRMFGIKASPFSMLSMLTDCTFSADHFVPDLLLGVSSISVKAMSALSLESLHSMPSWT